MEAALSIVIAWHTPDERYTALANRLRDQLDGIGQKHRIYTIEPVGDWRANILHTKARLVREAMCQHAKEQLLFLDLDVDIRGPIAPLFERMQNCDAAFSVRHKRDFGSKVAFSGRVYLFNPTIRARHLAALWEKECASGRAKKEEDAIARIIGCDGPLASIKIIPPEYACYEIGTEPPDAVIVHKSEHARDHAWRKRIEQSARRQWRKLIGRSERSSKRGEFEKLGFEYYD
jgi:hypothetical protein